MVEHWISRQIFWNQVKIGSHKNLDLFIDTINISISFTPIIKFLFPRELKAICEKYDTWQIFLSCHRFLAPLCYGNVQGDQKNASKRNLLKILNYLNIRISFRHWKLNSLMFLSNICSLDLWLQINCFIILW